MRTIRIGTRGSLLARTQTGWVAERLRESNPGLAVETVIIQTTGDLRRDVPFSQVGTKGMFVKEIETALLDGEIDLGVHSLKDMPGKLPAGLTLACVPEREDPRDALISRDGLTLDELPASAIIGTSSVRRAAQLRHRWPGFDVRELRGNLDTRLRKLDEGEYAAIVLACAGLNRLGLAERITERIPGSICVPAVGQGALALETRIGDDATSALLAPLNHEPTALCVRAERAFQAVLNAGCSVPAGAYAEMTMNGEISITGVIASPDGAEVLREVHCGAASEPEAVGRVVAMRLWEGGGRELLARKGDGPL